MRFRTFKRRGRRVGSRCGFVFLTDGVVKNDTYFVLERNRITDEEKSRCPDFPIFNFLNILYVFFTLNSRRFLLTREVLA